MFLKDDKTNNQKLIISYNNIPGLDVIKIYSVDHTLQNKYS